MQMIERITQAVGCEIKLEIDEFAVMQKLLSAAFTGTQQIELNMPEDRWLALGIHLVSVVRRVKNGNTLPLVEQAILEQVDSDMQDLSRQVLQAAEVTMSCKNDATEVLLLAVHFATAKHNS